MIVPTQGSRKENSYTKRGLHTSCEPRKGGSGHVGTWRERGDSDASERSERGEGWWVRYSFMADGAQSPWPATVLSSSCGGKVWDLPPVKIVLGGIEPARVKGHVAGPVGIHALPGGQTPSRTDSNFLRNLVYMQKNSTHVPLQQSASELQASYF